MCLVLSNSIVVYVSNLSLRLDVLLLFGSQFTYSLTPHSSMPTLVYVSYLSLGLDVLLFSSQFTYSPIA